MWQLSYRISGVRIPFALFWTDSFANNAKTDQTNKTFSFTNKLPRNTICKLYFPWSTWITRRILWIYWLIWCFEPKQSVFENPTKIQVIANSFKFIESNQQKLTSKPKNPRIFTTIKHISFFKALSEKSAQGKIANPKIHKQNRSIWNKNIKHEHDLMRLY